LTYFDTSFTLLLICFVILIQFQSCMTLT